MNDLYYYRARYYDPNTQRFLSLDPIEFDSGDYNFYRYVGNDPVNFVDPSGLASDMVIPVSTNHSLNSFAQDLSGPTGDMSNIYKIEKKGNACSKEVENVCPPSDNLCQAIGNNKCEIEAYNNIGSFLYDKLAGPVESLTGNLFENNATKIQFQYVEEWEQYKKLSKSRSVASSAKPTQYKPKIPKLPKNSGSSCKDWINKTTSDTPEDIDIALENKWDYCLRHEDDNLSK